MPSRADALAQGSTRAASLSANVEKHHERFLIPEELHRRGQVLHVAPAERLASPHSAAAIRLFVLTGCRRN